MLKRIIAAILAIFTLALSLSSCARDKTFSHAELSIVLDTSYDQIQSEQYDLLLDNGDSSVGVKRISLYAASLSGIPDSFSPERFAEHVLSERGEPGEVYTYKDVPYFSLYEAVSGKEFYTLYTFYRSKYAYFIIAFATPSDGEGDLRERFFEFADSVYFTS